MAAHTILSVNYSVSLKETAILFPEFATTNNMFHNIISPLNYMSKGLIVDNVINKKFGKWTIKEFVGRDSKSEQIYICECECGFVKEHALSTLKGEKSTQCKTCRMSEFNKREEIIGKTIGFWTVLQKIKDVSRNEWKYKCRCACGTEKEVLGYRLRAGTANKCPHCRVKTHGMSYTATFRIWSGLFRRCYNKNFKAYKWYGGRGITVCERWSKFENFLEDMGIRPENLQLDRTNNDGNYEPTNCRWVTSKVNNANRNIIKKKKEI